MGAKERTVQPVSQATPLAEDILGLMRGRIGAGGLGPLTALQGLAGQSLANFIPLLESGQQTDALRAQMEAIQRQETGAQVGDLRESFGIAGSRFGTPLALGEAGLRSQLGVGFGEQQARILQEQQNIQNQQLLQAIGLGGQLSAQQIAPFMQLGGMGILPTQTFFEQNPFVTALGGLAGLGAGVGGALTGLGPLGAGILGGAGS
ncbi:MAG: hypothetical protein ACYSW3_25470 [Planctomycetota bacterium]|jgi:hypothetical protein